MEQDTAQSPIDIPPELDPAKIIKQDGEFTGAIDDKELAGLAANVSQHIYRALDDPEGYKKASEQSSERSMEGLTAGTAVESLTKQGVNRETAIEYTVESSVISVVREAIRARVLKMNPDASEEKQKELTDLLAEKVTREWETANKQKLQDERERVAKEKQEKIDRANAEINSIIERLKGPKPPTVEELLPGFRVELPTEDKASEACDALSRLLSDDPSNDAEVAAAMEVLTTTGAPGRNKLVEVASRIGAGGSDAVTEAIKRRILESGVNAGNIILDRFATDPERRDYVSIMDDPNTYRSLTLEELAQQDIGVIISGSRVGGITAESANRILDSPELSAPLDPGKKRVFEGIADQATHEIQ